MEGVVEGVEDLQGQVVVGEVGYIRMMVYLLEEVGMMELVPLGSPQAVQEHLIQVQMVQ